MSWNAYIGDKSWNYTHNTNEMIATVLEEHGAKMESHWLIGHMGKSWFTLLNGLSGRAGAKFLQIVVDGLERDPDRFVAMNPPNGWGSYDTLLPKLREMLAASRHYPNDTWEVHG